MTINGCTITPVPAGGSTLYEVRRGGRLIGASQFLSLAIILANETEENENGA